MPARERASGACAFCRRGTNSLAIREAGVQMPEAVLAIPQLLLLAGVHFGIAVGGIVSVNHR